MAYQIGDSRYGFSFKTANGTDLTKFATKTVNYVNLKLDESGSGYTPNQVAVFIDSIAESIIGAAATQDRLINDQIAIEYVP